MYVASVQILCEKVNNFFYFSRTANPLCPQFLHHPLQSQLPLFDHPSIMSVCVVLSV